MPQLIFLSFQHEQYIQAEKLASMLRRKFQWKIRLFISDPQDLFESPVEELAAQLTDAHVIIQLRPRGIETDWMAAERIFAEELSIPVLVVNESILSNEQLRHLKMYLRESPPFLNYSTYLRQAVLSTYDPEPPPPKKQRIISKLLIFGAAITAILAGFFTIFAVGMIFVQEREFSFHDELENDMPRDLTSQWEKGLGRAFSRTQEYDVEMQRVKDEFDWTGMSSTPMEINQPVRKLIARTLIGLFVVLTLIVDILIAIARLTF